MWSRLVKQKKKIMEKEKHSDNQDDTIKIKTEVVDIPTESEEIDAETDVEIKEEILDPDAGSSSSQWVCPAARLCLICSSVCSSKFRIIETEPLGSLILFLLQKIMYVPLDDLENQESFEKFTSACANICINCVPLVQEAFTIHKQIKQLKERARDIKTILYSTLSKKESTNGKITCELYQSMRSNFHSSCEVDDSQNDENDVSCSKKSNDDNFVLKSKSGSKRRKLYKRSSLNIEKSHSPSTVSTSVKKSKRTTTRDKTRSKRKTPQQNSASAKSDVEIDCSNVLFDNDNDDGPPYPAANEANDIPLSTANSDKPVVNNNIDCTKGKSNESAAESSDSDMDFSPPSPASSSTSNSSSSSSYVPSKNNTRKGKPSKKIYTDWSLLRKKTALMKKRKKPIRKFPFSLVKVRDSNPCFICDANFISDAHAVSHRLLAHPDERVCFVNNCHKVLRVEEIEKHRKICLVSAEVDSSLINSMNSAHGSKNSSNKADSSVLSNSKAVKHKIPFKKPNVIFKTPGGKVVGNSGTISNSQSEGKKAIVRAKKITLLRAAPKTDLKFPCVICDSEFTSDAKANNHIKINHPGLGVCFINNCRQVFLAKDLDDHRQQTHGFFSCTSCSVKVASYSCLIAHSKHYHPTLEIPLIPEDDFNSREISPLDKNNTPSFSLLLLPPKITPLSKEEIQSYLEENCQTPSKSVSTKIMKYPPINAYGKSDKVIDVKEEQNKSIDLPLPPPPVEKKVIFKCGVCEEKFEDKQSLVTHFQSTHNKKLMFACHICKKKFPSMKNYETHFSTAHPKKVATVESSITEKIPCDVKNCSEVFPSAAALTRHKVLIHKKSKIDFQPDLQLRRVWKCAKCYCRFKTERELEEHKTKHEKPPPIDNACKDEECSKEFKNDKGLKQLKDRSHNKKSYKYARVTAPNGMVRVQCQHCSDTYSSSSKLRMHIKKQHLQVKPFECNLCDQKFLFNSMLTLHTRRAHTGERPFICEVETCRKGFFTLEKLRRHTEIHSDIRSHLCDICGKAFKTDNNLYIHRQSHDPDRKEKFPAYKPNPNKPKHPKGYKGVRGRQRGLIANENGVVEGLPIRLDPAKPKVVTPVIEEGAKENDNDKNSTVTKVSKKSCNENSETKKDNKSKVTKGSENRDVKMPVPDSLSVEQFE